MLFKDDEKKKDKPKIIGDDFDVFPALDEDNSESLNATQAVNTQKEQETDDDPGLTDFQKKIAAIPENKFILLQKLTGVAIALISGALLTVLSGLLPNNFGFYGALLLCIISPSVLERQTAKKMPKLRFYLLITLLIFLVLYLVYNLVIKPSLLGQ